jgi:hypothetical protein
MTMKHHNAKKLLALVLSFVLIAAAALTGCSGAPTETTGATGQVTNTTELGEGSKTFELTIEDKEGVIHSYRIHTDEEMVGFALIAHELIEGEQGQYGMYIKSVLGQTLDYETDGMYWAFYVNGEYALTGVDQTPIQADTAYLLKAEAA